MENRKSQIIIPADLWLSPEGLYPAPKRQEMTSELHRQEPTREIWRVVTSQDNNDSFIHPAIQRILTEHFLVPRIFLAAEDTEMIKVDQSPSESLVSSFFKGLHS